MAYIPNQQKKEDQTSPSGQPSGQGAGVLSSSGTGTGPIQNKKQSFATLQSYLKTNKPQGEQFAGKLAEGVSQVGQQAQKGIDDTTQKLTSEAQANTLNYDPNIVKEATQNPTTFVQDADKLKTFTDYRTASYGGPQSAESTADYQKAQSDAAAALERSKLVDTESGRKQLASEAQKSQAGGITALNQALLSTNPNAAATLQGTKAPFANLQSSLGASAESINAQIKAAQDAADQARTGVREGITPLKSNLQSELQDTLSTARTNLPLNVEKAIANYKLGQATPEDLKLLGFDSSDLSDAPLSRYSQYANVLQQDYNTPTNYGALFTQQSPDFVYSSPDSVATPEQFAYEQALEKLAGEDLNILGSQGEAIPPVTPNRQGLTDLREQVTARDSAVISDAFFQTPGIEDLGITTPSQFSAWLRNSYSDGTSGPPRAQALLDLLKRRAGNTVEGLKQVETLANALTRQGFQVTNATYTPPPSTGKKPGIVYAS